jgi:hypothetical protein
MASSITLDGLLTDWTNVDRLDFGMIGLDGSKIYGRYVDGTYNFAIESSKVTIGAYSTMWLNTDQNEATGFKIFGSRLGADYKIEFEGDGLGGVRPALYSVTDTGATTLVPDGVAFKLSADGKVVELAVDKAKINNSTTISTLIDLNIENSQGPDGVYLPGDYSLPPFKLTNQEPPVRTDTTLKVGIVFSESTA